MRKVRLRGVTRPGQNPTANCHTHPKPRAQALHFSPRPEVRATLPLLKHLAATGLGIHRDRDQGCEAIESRENYGKQRIRAHPSWQPHSTRNGGPSGQIFRFSRGT